MIVCPFMQAARIVKVKEPLEIQSLETPKPKGSQVLVKVESAGVCHSDIHLWEWRFTKDQQVVIKTTDRGCEISTYTRS